MSSPSDAFESQWQPSRQLLVCYALIQGLALLSLALVDIPLWALLLGIGFCVAHAAWVLPRHLLLNAPQAAAYQVWSIEHDPQGKVRSQSLFFDQALTPPLTVKDKGVRLSPVSRLTEAVDRISQNRY